MDEKTFKKLLAEQTKSIDAKMDQRFIEQNKSIDAKLDQRFAEQTKAIDAKFVEQNNAIDDKLEAQDVRMMQYVGALSEQYQEKLQAALEIFIPLLQLPQQVSELAESVYEMRQIVDPTFERVGELSESEATTTETLDNHEKRIRVLEKR
ncbi:MAG: hypothetical protein AAB649_01090 [Patescibacteria group bacterium]